MFVLGAGFEHLRRGFVVLLSSALWSEQFGESRNSHRKVELVLARLGPHLKSVHHFKRMSNIKTFKPSLFYKHVTVPFALSIYNLH